MTATGLAHYGALGAHTDLVGVGIGVDSYDVEGNDHGVVRSVTMTGAAEPPVRPWSAWSGLRRPGDPAGRSPDRLRSRASPVAR